ncbi:homoserine kinase [Aliikangiella sp. IMCC44653]
MKVTAFAPISIGNLSVGFDTLGLALKPISHPPVGDYVTICQTKNSQSQLNVSGSYAHKLPQEHHDNIVWRCWRVFQQKLKQQKIPLQPVDIELIKDIPVSSGLGSSACSVVAALVGLNQFFNKPFNSVELLRLMGQLESEISGGLHYDNVAPSFLGGLQLMHNDTHRICSQLPIFNDVYWVIAYPDVSVSTKAAREILPQQYPRKTLVESGQNLAGFIHASYQQDKVFAFKMLKDVIAEPYRKNLIPGFSQAKSALLKLGSLAVGISGSGPTLFSACDNLEQAKVQADWLNQHYLTSDQGFVHICQADVQGARTNLNQ